MTLVVCCVIVLQTDISQNFELLSSQCFSFMLPLLQLGSWFSYSRRWDTSTWSKMSHCHLSSSCGRPTFFDI